MKLRTRIRSMCGTWHYLSWLTTRRKNVSSLVSTETSSQGYFSVSWPGGNVCSLVWVVLYLDEWLLAIQHGGQGWHNSLGPGREEAYHCVDWGGEAIADLQDASNQVLRGFTRLIPTHVPPLCFCSLFNISFGEHLFSPKDFRFGYGHLVDHFLALTTGWKKIFITWFRFGESWKELWFV